MPGGARLVGARRSRCFEAKGIIHRVAQIRVVPIDPATTGLVDVILP